MMSARARSRGFTLTELLITLTLLGVMAAFAIPSFRSFVANTKVKTASYELMTTVLMARSEAIKRNAAVTLTPASTTSWASGWSVTAPDGTTVHGQALMDQVTITQKDATKATVTPTTAISFGSTGRPAAGAYFEITGTGGNAVKCVKLDAAGVASSSNGSC